MALVLVFAESTYIGGLPTIFGVTTIHWNTDTRALETNTYTSTASLQYYADPSAAIDAWCLAPTVSPFTRRTVRHLWLLSGVRSYDTLLADPTGTVLIDGSATLSFQPGESAIIVSDGLAFYTIGFGQSATFAFDYTSINVAGSGNYTLTGTELNRIAYGFTGVLTGNRTIIVPATVQQYWVNNETTGPYNFTVKTSAGTGVIVASGSRSILYCDGTDVVNADTGGLAVPIQVSDGGTGATTAGAARINLGATAVGDAIFTAADGPAAYAALGIAPAGVVVGGTF